MDASKLLNVISDLNRYEPEKLSNKIQELINALPNGDIEVISLLKQELINIAEESYINNYSASNLEIVDVLGAKDYYGINAINAIDKILNSHSYSTQVYTVELEKYLKSRNDFVNLIKNSSDNLYKLNLHPHYFSNSVFEVGILMPKASTGNKILNITKHLNKWDKVFKDFKELVGEDREDTTIDFISNGSLQFFIENTPTVAVCLTVAVERILKLYKHILDIRIAKNQLMSLGVKTTELANIEEQEKLHLQKGLAEVSADIVKKYADKNIDKSRLNELTTAINIQIKFIAKSIDQGIIIEIIPPEIEEPKKEEDESVEENVVKHKNDILQYQKTKKQIEVVQKSLDVIKEISYLSGDFRKYLENNDVDDKGEEPE